ncbi:uncharacterized protein LOC108705602 isoform X4 [Xenopus laevis]|uniref:Uncharacterized protein LOC108705602 isoform X4 n=1 Tax=Xenopus laevis TaxID=8355 RepID=A0A8J1LSZ2_XENLA|nr:uncharacterized protein LOC108705602 isoform X4 [Xenopus laevis]
MYRALLRKMNMEPYENKDLTLQDFLQIERECLQNIGDGQRKSAAWNFIRKIIALNETARKSEDGSEDLLDDSVDETCDSSNSVHPLDVQCLVLHCCDHFLQQEIILRMSMCQFAVPLLLPDVDGPGCTFMLWGMRDIVKRWRPQSLTEKNEYMEDNLVQISMPTFSFVRLGESTLSISYILNQVLSSTQHIFVHGEMEGGNVTREISEGLVEISWYFPAGKSNSDIFSEPVSFANLCGNLEDNLTQFAFLTQISSAVFIFVKNIDQNLYDFLSQYENSQTNFVIIIKTNVKIDKNTNLANTTVIVFRSKDNVVKIAERLRKAAVDFIKKRCRVLSLEDMSEIASKLGISIDENETECQNAKADAKAITDEIKDVAEYKKKTMKLQGNLWEKLSELEKEMCQMKQQGDEHGESYKLEIQKQCVEIREQQYNCKIPKGISSFINSVLKKNHIEKLYFFKWLRFYLDSTARKNRSVLQAEYKEKSELSGLDHKILASSLGIEHFIRELSQFYEAEDFMLKHRIANKRQFMQLPAFAADLLLGGFPLELIDGDASNIPLQWLQDVLHELDNKTGKCCRMGVITVLGVQSTGKSTLLNTMFGLQFPVSSGRCTRGAFMTLMKVRENFQAELGCEFILVIDTEGLRAPELTSLENSYEHDNELATLVIGLSDITIVNMSMENTSEMKDILQIVVHAFLRMKEIGRKPNCHFVHQNVSDISAHENNSRDRIKLLEHLNEITKIAANMEKKIKFTAFSDIMKYDPDKDSCYIPGLWNGVPPMASISTAYSEAIFELKTYLIECMKNKGHRIDDFIEWIKSLWNAVKHENFIFSFKNSLVAIAYYKLSKKYSELEWKFTKTILNWLAETETVIKNQNAQMADSEGTKCTTAVYSILSDEEKNMQEELEKYFSNENKDASLIERFKEEFLTSVSCLRKKLESSSLNKCAEIIRIKKENFKVRNVISAYKQVIDKKVTSLVMKFREEKCKPNEKTLEEEFELMWADTISELNVTALPELNIELNLLAQLKKEMAAKGSSVNQRLNNISQLLQQEKLHLHESQALCLLNHVKRLHILDSAAGDKLEEFLKSLSEKCSEYIKNKLSSESDYDETYGLELLYIIHSVCDENKFLQISADIELELKLFILGNALGAFQHMHKEFVKKNDPLICLGEMKPKYWKSFQYLFQEKNESWERAKHFCELWLKPALIKQVNRKLGYEIVDHILKDCQSNQFSTRMYFQFTVMKTLLEKSNFSDYLEYISDYETFVKKWINNCILEKCDFHHLQSIILSNITKKVKIFLNEPRTFQFQKVSDFLEHLKKGLRTDLVLSDDMDLFCLKDEANIKEFVENLEKSLSDTEAEIISEMKAVDKETILSNVVVKPVDELFKKVFGCGKQCPFCKAPCEAGGTEHKSHFASIHRPSGLGKYRIVFTQALCYDICTTNISGNKSFIHGSGSSHLYKEYRTVYPDWDILPDPSMESSDYWKYVLKEFNEHFAEEYEASPAEYPKEWNTITKAQAEKCLNTAFDHSENNTMTMSEKDDGKEEHTETLEVTVDDVAINENGAEWKEENTEVSKETVDAMNEKGAGRKEENTEPSKNYSPPTTIEENNIGKKEEIPNNLQDPSNFGTMEVKEEITGNLHDNAIDKHEEDDEKEQKTETTKDHSPPSTMDENESQEKEEIPNILQDHSENNTMTMSEKDDGKEEHTETSEEIVYDVALNENVTKKKKEENTEPSKVTVDDVAINENGAEWKEENTEVSKDPLNYGTMEVKEEITGNLQDNAINKHEEDDEKEQKTETTKDHSPPSTMDENETQEKEEISNILQDNAINKHEEDDEKEQNTETTKDHSENNTMTMSEKDDGKEEHTETLEEMVYDVALNENVTKKKKEENTEPSKVTVDDVAMNENGAEWKEENPEVSKEIVDAMNEKGAGRKEENTEPSKNPSNFGTMEVKEEITGNLQDNAINKHEEDDEKEQKTETTKDLSPPSTMDENETQEKKEISNILQDHSENNTMTMSEKDDGKEEHTETLEEIVYDVALNENVAKKKKEENTEPSKVTVDDVAMNENGAEWKEENPEVSKEIVDAMNEKGAGRKEENTEPSKKMVDKAERKEENTEPSKDPSNFGTMEVKEEITGNLQDNAINKHEEDDEKEQKTETIKDHSPPSTMDENETQEKEKISNILQDHSENNTMTMSEKDDGKEEHTETLEEIVYDVALNENVTKKKKEENTEPSKVTVDDVAMNENGAEWKEENTEVSKETVDDVAMNEKGAGRKEENTEPSKKMVDEAERKEENTEPSKDPSNFGTMEAKEEITGNLQDNAINKHEEDDEKEQKTETTKVTVDDVAMNENGAEWKEENPEVSKETVDAMNEKGAGRKEENTEPSKNYSPPTTIEENNIGKKEEIPNNLQDPSNFGTMEVKEEITGNLQDNAINKHEEDDEKEQKTETIKDPSNFGTMEVKEEITGNLQDHSPPSTMDENETQEKEKISNILQDHSENNTMSEKDDGKEEHTETLEEMVYDVALNENVTKKKKEENTEPSKVTVDDVAINENGAEWKEENPEVSKEIVDAMNEKGAGRKEENTEPSKNPSNFGTMEVKEEITGNLQDNAINKHEEDDEKEQKTETTKVTVDDVAMNENGAEWKEENPEVSKEIVDAMNEKGAGRKEENTEPSKKMVDEAERKEENTEPSKDPSNFGTMEAKEEITGNLQDNAINKHEEDDEKEQKTETTKDKKNLFSDLSRKMKMEPYENKTLTLQDFLQIDQECLQRMEDWQKESAAWNFIHKVIALNGTARSIVTKSEDENEDLQDHTDDNAVHILDVLCFVLHRCDNFLQQEIILKMSMCQFAVPLLLPDVDGPGCTFMLWGMRDIVKRWRPQSLAETKGFTQAHLVQISMPTFSFVRLGESKLSKSTILNQVLSPAQHTYEFFVHNNMEGADVTREISEGLTEISWYFPAGKGNSDIFSEPAAFANLHGNMEDNLMQFAFLTQISSAVFIFVENIDQPIYDFLSQYKNSKTTFVIIVKANSKIDKSTNLNNVTVLQFKSKTSEAIITKKIRATAVDFIKKECNFLKLEDMAEIASKLGISVDENGIECQNAKADAEAIAEEIKDVAQYKKTTMKLQGNLWKNLAKLEKEMCQMKKQGDKNGEHYKVELQNQRVENRTQQYQCEMPNGISKFIDSIKKRNHTENHYFLKWLRFYLDLSAMNNLSALQTEYKQMTSSHSMTQLSELDQKISDSSLGIEHFLRELGQFYEAEHFMLKEENAKKRKFAQLPTYAADLLLRGFPLELIDGDASNIPLQWLQDVLHELDNKTGKCCRMGVITVLGVQSTGKSTLLNTMFGLQFPVSSGRCTRGAFMTLMKVRENFQGELGCEFILVIDTEGLRAPELTSLENSNEHDNELATLVVGLSDITIVNMAMENTTEMKDILQIVVHAFLRMKEIGRKPKCYFVHQNVSEVSAHENNRRDRVKLLEHLNEMTKIAANMENKTKFTAFSDIMIYDPEKDNSYIPGLWNGVPPMASINVAYSETIYELKAYLIESMKNKGHKIGDFMEWIESLWTAVKYENFIFSFRNSLVANAYNQLAKKYSELEWKFTKSMHNWLAETETVIKNQNAQTVDSEAAQCKRTAYVILGNEEVNMQAELEKYFSSENKDASLVERYKAEFLTSASCLRKKLESSSISKCDEAIRIHKENLKVKNIISAYKEVIDKKVASLVMKCREQKYKPDEKKLEEEFEVMWTNIIAELNVTALPEPNVELELLTLLKRDMTLKGSCINQRLNNINKLPKQEKLHVHENKVKSFFKKIRHTFLGSSAYSSDELEVFLKSLSDICSEYIKGKLKSESDYDETYGLELLNLINLVCDGNKDFQITSDAELDLKLFILGNAVGDFQQMHKEFVKKNDPLICLGEMKPKYCKSFQYLFLEKDESWERAKHFCDFWLKPALIEQLNRKLGYEIVDHILENSESNHYRTRGYFQFTVMKTLLEKSNFSDYLEYISDYETFVKKWIDNCILEKCDFHHLQSIILSNITKKIKRFLNEPRTFPFQKVSDFLEHLKKGLRTDLVLSDDMDLFCLKDEANIKEFVGNLEKSLSDTEAEIISEMKAVDKETIFSNVVVKPVDELFKRVFGCGKQCPFCRVPCEAGGTDHKNHFASIHRPTGLGKYRSFITQDLCYDICTTNISGDKSFIDKSGSLHLYKEYRTVYPDWDIPPDRSFEASDYWKYVLKEFNEQFAKEYEARPAEYPKEWNTITKPQAETSLKTAFCMK